MVLMIAFLLLSMLTASRQGYCSAYICMFVCQHGRTKIPWSTMHSLEV